MNPFIYLFIYLKLEFIIYVWYICCNEANPFNPFKKTWTEYVGQRQEQLQV